jgi:hypothetical protein
LFEFQSLRVPIPDTSVARPGAALFYQGEMAAADPNMDATVVGGERSENARP